MSTITAKDLTKEYPRSPYAELDGLPWLPRLIDKVRALHAGTLGDYTPFPCGGDQNFLNTLGLNADELKKVIAGGASDQEIAAWVKAHMAPEATSKLEAYRQQQRAAYPAGSEYHGYLQHALEELKKARPGIDLSKVDNFSRMICVEEGHQLP